MAITFSYTTRKRILGIEPAIGSVTTISSADLTLFVQDAEAEVSARIARQYTVPVSGSALLTSIATDVAIYRVLSRRIFTQERLKTSGWVDRFREALDTLGEIASGKILLVDADGALISNRTDVAEVYSNNMGYEPSMSELPEGLDRVDVDKQEDLAEARGDFSFRDWLS